MNLSTKFRVIETGVRERIALPRSPDYNIVTGTTGRLVEEVHFAKLRSREPLSTTIEIEFHPSRNEEIIIGDEFQLVQINPDD